MRRLADRYRPLRGLPGSSTATVVLAQDRLLATAVVLKFAAADSAAAADLAREGEVTERVRHPALVGFVERFEGRIDDRERVVVGLATRWIDGAPIDVWSPRVGLGERLSAVASVVDAVDHLHRSGWLHLDLKPDNVLVGRDGPVVLDLGSARPMDAGAGTAGGTLGYAAPEVIAGEAPSAGSDIYSLGALLYRLLSGEGPFAEHEGSALRAAVLRGDVVPLRARVSDVDLAIADAVHAMLATRPADRPGSLREIRDRLRDIGIDVPRRAGRPPLVGRADALDDLVERLADPGRPPTPVALVGPLGSGRSRLAQELLARLPRAGGAVALDLTETGPVPAALAALLSMLGAPGGGALDDRRLLGWIASRHLTGAVFVGRLEDEPELAAPRGRELLCALARAGLLPIVAAESLPPWADPHALAPLYPDDVDRLVGGLGVVDVPGAREIARDLDGLPGSILDVLSGPGSERADGRAVLGAWWPLVRLLPDGLFADSATELPAPLADLVDAALVAGVLRRVGRRVFGFDPAGLAEDLTEPQVALAREAVATIARRDPLAASVLAARTGLYDEAEGFLSALEDAPWRREAREVAERLTAVGVARGRLLLARILVAIQPDPARAASILAEIEPSDPVGVALAVALGRQGDALGAVETALSWTSLHGWHPDVAGECCWTLATRGKLESLASLLDRIDAEAPRCAEDRLVAASRLVLAVERHRAGGSLDDLRAAVLGVEARHPSGEGLDRTSLFPYAVAWRILGDQERSVGAGERAVALSDAEGLVLFSLSARLNLAVAYMHFGRSADARRAYQQAESLALAMRTGETLAKICASVAELEIRVGRLPAAERYLRRLDDAAVGMADPREARVRGALLRAAFDAARGEHRAALERLTTLDALSGPVMLRVERDLRIAEMLVELGMSEEAVRALEALGDLPKSDPELTRRLQLARGRAYLGLGRSYLARVADSIPSDPDAIDRTSSGRALLAVAGEDLDVESFGRRREMLRRAAQLLQGDPQSKAVALRERLLDRPGAALDQIVSLIEAIGDVDRFVEGLARIVATSLGAHRALVMLRIPGLGRQVSAREISGQEVAGLAPEVWKRVRHPDDVWRSDDAFADPNLRRMSSTVRTFQIKSVVAVAIPRDGQVIGALYVDDLQRAGRFDDRDVEVLRRLARAIGRVADAIPSQAAPGGLTVHDVHGVYLSSADEAARMRATLDRLRTQPQANMMIAGPTGAGKTWMAARIAAEVMGLRGLVEVVLRPGDPDKLISMLWGTRRGEFTGAIDQSGAIQRAWKGGKALFLDEVQNLDETGQRVLLPLLELPHRRFGAITGEVQQLDRPLQIILGTNAPLDDGAWARHFREDLWFRMSQFRVDLPPLAARGREAIYRHLGDLLAERKLPAPEVVFDPGALARIAAHSWPGNLRGLSGFVDQVAFGFKPGGPAIRSADLRELGLVHHERPAPQPLRPLDDAQARRLLVELQRCDWVQSDAARNLGLSKYALHRLLKRHDLLDVVRARRFGMAGEG